jgi:bacterioferritin
MASKKMLDLLNQAISREIAVSVQYMWQHVMAVGITGSVASPVFKASAITEMKHAEALAERLNFLGGVPTTKPTAIKVGGTTKEMLKDNIKAEQDAVAIYREMIDLAIKEKDWVTKKMAEGILADEEGHLDAFGNLAEGL